MASIFVGYFMRIHIAFESWRKDINIWCDKLCATYNIQVVVVWFEVLDWEDLPGEK